MKRPTSFHALTLAVLFLSHCQPVLAQIVTDPSSADTISLDSIVSDSVIAASMRRHQYESTVMQRFPDRGIDRKVAVVPGVIMQGEALFFRGGRSDEIGSYLDGFPIADVVKGGRSITVQQDALSGITVNTGNYSVAEGWGNSGLVHYTTCTGGERISGSLQYVSDNIGMMGKSSAFSGLPRLGAYWYGYSETNATLGGPIVDPRFRFFGSFNYLYQRDRDPKRYPGIHLTHLYTPGSSNGDTLDLIYPAGALLKNSLEQTSFLGSISLDFSPVIIRLTGTAAHKEYDNPFNNGINPGNIANLFNTARIEKVLEDNSIVGMKAMYNVNQHSRIELSGGYSRQSIKAFDPYLQDNFLRYGDSITNAAAGFTWPGRYQAPPRKLLFNFRLNSNGTVVANYQKFRNEALHFAGRFTTQVFSLHKIEIGGEIQSFTIRNYSLSNGGLLSLAHVLDDNAALPAGDPNKLAPAQILTRFGVNNVGYDALGNEIDEESPLGPRRPVLAGAYLQDQVTVGDFTLTGGLQYDYIDIDNYALKDPSRPDLAIGGSTNEVIESGLRKTAKFDAVSPRIGVMGSVSERTTIYTSWAQYVQQPRLRDAYMGYSAFGATLSIDGYNLFPIGLDIRPERAQHWELGIRHEIREGLWCALTGFYKKMTDQVILGYQAMDPRSRFGDYYFLRNGGRTLAKGLTFELWLRRWQRLQVDGSITVQDAKGHGAFPTSNLVYVLIPPEPGGVTRYHLAQLSDSPLETSNTFRSNLLLDYRFTAGDGGSILEQLGMTLLLTANSGHPYTRYTLREGPWPFFQGRPAENPGASTTPWVFQVDLRVDKTFMLVDKLSANVSLAVINLFDAKNVQNVFLTTGQPDDDGWLSDPQFGGVLINTYGQAFADVYRAINLDYHEQYQNGFWPGGIPTIYGPPRQIRFGLKLEY